VLRDGVPVRRVWARSGTQAFRLREVDSGLADQADCGSAGEGESGPAGGGESDPVGVPTGAQMTVTRCGPDMADDIETVAAALTRGEFITAVEDCGVELL
jgi:(S)-beta-tyrosine adenylation enzyme